MIDPNRAKPALNRMLEQLSKTKTDEHERAASEILAHLTQEEFWTSQKGYDEAILWLAEELHERDIKAYDDGYEDANEG